MPDKPMPMVAWYPTCPFEHHISLSETQLIRNSLNIRYMHTLFKI